MKESSTNCFNCGQKIGADDKFPPGITGTHLLVQRPGHFRIFKDLKHKMKEFDDYKDNDKCIPNMLLEDYKNNIINPILEKSKFGINKVSKFIFEDKSIVIRKLTQAGYRLLNFILYSHLFFSNCLGFIPDEIMNETICDGMTCIQMLVTDWNLLKEELHSKGIQIIQIFMNLIFPKISEKIKNCKLIKSSEEREKFEDDIEKLLQDAYAEYEEYSKKYLQFNQELFKNDKYNMKSLLLENNDIKNYDEENYPLYKYFLMTTYPSKEAFIYELKNVPEYKKNILYWQLI